MELQDLQKLDIVTDDGESKVTIQFDRLEQEFTDTDRNQILYSKVKLETKDFCWDAVLPTVKIPYRDPSVGFLLEGVVFSSVGIYQRAPGVVLGKDQESVLGMNDRVDIVTSRNSTISIGYKRNGIQICFRKGGRERFVPIGIFLKAFSGLPYAVLLKGFAFKPPALLNSFPCEVPQRAVDLAKVASYGIDSTDEPDVESCIDMVYSALMQFDARSQGTAYSSHWKSSRIKLYFNGLHFKTEANYESTLSVHSRAVGQTLDQELNVSYYGENGSEQKAHYARGTFINEDIATFLRWHDVDVLRVRGDERSYLLQEASPMLFRCVGYKLAGDLKDLNLYAGDIITKETCKEINASEIKLLQVYTPNGRKVLSRSSGDPEVGDFVTILNCLLTASFLEHDETTQYEVANRVVVDYTKQVLLEVEQTYVDITNALSSCQSLKSVIDSLPKLPSTRLNAHLRDSGTKELSQAEITNVMARAVAEKRASALMKEAPAAMTAVQKGQYARIDSLHSPESDKVGAVQEITAMAHLNSETGELEAPYEKVVNGVPTGEIEYISASKEANKYIVGWDNKLESETVLARYNGDVTTVERERVNYRDASPFCDMSVSRMTIPFPEFSQPRRSLMATKMSGQAIPLLFPERPRVSTGADTEIPCLYYTARQIIESSLGPGSAKAGSEPLEVLNVKWTPRVAMYTCVYDGNSFVFSVPFMATDQKSLYNYNLNYKEGYKYQLDEIVFYNQSCDMAEHEYWERVEQGSLPLIKNFGKPAMALGVNLTVMYKTFGSSTVDDAVVINDRVIGNRKLSSIQVFKYEYKLKRGERFSAYNGVPKVHSHVYAKEPVIRVIRRSVSANSNEKCVYADQSGEVILAEVNEATKEANVWVATIHDAAPGDKIAGRYGNKSVIAKVIPNCEMPYDPETGETVDVVLSPLGIPSRMNFGQLLEVTLGATMSQQDKFAVVTPFYPGIKGEVEDLYKQSGLSQKRLYNPKYGKFTERPVMVGTMYFLKLEQMSNLKYSAVGYPIAVDPVFGQPVDSVNSDKGQRVGEMETWSLIAAGTKKTLNSMFTVYASDERSRSKYFEMLEGNSDVGPDGWDEYMGDAISYQVDNKDAIVTQTIVRMFGLDLDMDASNNHYRFVPLDLENIPMVASLLDLKNHNEPTEDNEWCKVKLQAPVINPFWINNFPLNEVLGVKSVKTLVSGKYYLNVYDRTVVPEKDLTDWDRARRITGISAVIALLRNTTVDEAIERLTMRTGAVASEPNNAVEVIQLDAEDTIVLDDAEGEGEVKAKASASGETVFKNHDGDEDDDNVIILDSPDGELDDMIAVPASVAELVRFLQRMKALGLELKDLVWDYMPIMPKVFRQSNVIGDVEREQSFHKQLRHICEGGRSEDIYRMLEQLIGYGNVKSSDLETLRGYFFGKGSESGDHGNMRKRVLSKRVGFTGRSVIVPATDINMSPFFVGIPWHLAMTELSKVLAIRLKKRSTKMDSELLSDVGPNCRLSSLTYLEWEDIIESLWQYNEFVFSKHFPAVEHSDRVYLYNYIRSEVRKICEGNVSPDGKVRVKGEWVNVEDVPEDETIDAAVVCIGRQPTLHKRSIRTFFMKLVDGYSLEIHPVVCGGFNADFDGDTMWHCQLLGEMKNEAWRSMSCLQDLISEKDGSYTLGLVQDTALGLYAASIFKNNTLEFVGAPGKYFYFDDKDVLKLELEYGTLNYYDVVVYRHHENDCWYISTAGRVLLNLCVPGAMTQTPFTDPYGICKQVLGEEAVSQFRSMKYDKVWVATSTKPKDGADTIKIEKVLLDLYHAEGARASVLTTQALYEVGLVASDIYSVTASMDDMSVDCDVSKFMEEPKEYVRQLNSLEQMGLITEQERKDASVRAWNRAYKQATDGVLDAIPRDSNTHFLLYSGARGKIGQIMQSVGFVGTISKTATSDIEYPILTGYGHGLSSMDLFQTCYMARIGVVSTQSGTKATGYSTRQTVYMSSGMEIKEADCGIEMRVEPVNYSSVNVDVKMPDGSVIGLDDLEGKSVDPSSERQSNQMLMSDLNRSGYLINDDILCEIVRLRLTELDLLDGPIEITYHLDSNWKAYALENGYSYALPYTVNRKITEESLQWVEGHGLRDIIMFDRECSESEDCFDREAYLPVEYDRSKFALYVNGSKVDEEVVYGKSVSPDSERYHYYQKLLGPDNAMTMKALQYLTKKGVHLIQLENGTTVQVRYKISKLFKDLVLNRTSAALPYLDDEVITTNTLDEIERVQLDAIPVRTSLTCLSHGGICSTCNGKSMSTDDYASVGTNLGIAAAQAQCEPLSQSTLNVTHSGGKRGEGVGQLQGLPYYMKMLQGKLVSEKTEYLLEGFAGHSGYVKCNAHDNHFFQIVSDDGEVLESWELDDPARLNVVDGAYVDAGDTVKSGRPVLDRYSSRDIFKSALQTRYLLLKEYYGIFKDLNVSPRNYEILAREQTSQCFLDKEAPLPPVKDTCDEIRKPTGAYVLRVSRQSQVVNKFSGVAGFAFENVANMLSAGVLNSDGLALNSVLGNLVTGTPVGSDTVRFIPKRFGVNSSKYKKSAVRHAEEQVAQLGDGRYAMGMALGTHEPQKLGAVTESANTLLNVLFEAEKAIEAEEAGLNRLQLGGGEIADPDTELDFGGDDESVTPMLELPEDVVIDEPEVIDGIEIVGSASEEPSMIDIIEIAEVEVIEDDDDSSKGNDSGFNRLTLD